MSQAGATQQLWTNVTLWLRERRVVPVREAGLFHDSLGRALDVATRSRYDLR